MKLVDILARELKAWPVHQDLSLMQGENGRVYQSGGGITVAQLPRAVDWGISRVTMLQWQAEVDALNAPKVVEWDGIGDPPVGTVCEYDARPSEKGEPLFVTVEVKYVSDQSIVIICTDVPDGEKKENIGVELALMNGLAMRGKLRPIRTAEQVAAEDREKAIKDLYYTINWNDDSKYWGDGVSAARKADYAKAIDAGYTKVAK